MSSTLIECWINRSRDFTIPILQADGVTPYNLATATDVVHLKIGRGPSAVTLELTSAAPTTNGSTLTFSDGSNIVSCHVAMGDITNALQTGAYDYELEVVRSAVGLHVQTGVFFLHGVPGMA